MGFAPRSVDGVRWASDEAAPTQSAAAERANKIANFMTGATRLAVPFKERKAAQKRGGRWNPIGKFWYVPQGMDADKFAEWKIKPVPEPMVIPAGTCVVYFDGGAELIPEGEPAVVGRPVACSAIVKKCAPIRCARCRALRDKMVGLACAALVCLSALFLLRPAAGSRPLSPTHSSSPAGVE